MRLIVYYLLSIVLLCLSCSSYSRDVTVLASKWQHYTNEDETGIYFDLLRLIYHESDLRIEITDYHRCLNLFKQEKADILIGVYQSDLPKAHYAQWPLDKDAPIFAFVHKESPYNNLASLTNKTVAWQKGYGFDQFFNTIQNPYLVSNLETGFRLLQGKRIDAFFDYQLNYRPKEHTDVSFFKVHDAATLYLAFQNTKRGRLLAKIYDQRMPVLRQNGVLASLFADRYLNSGLNEFIPH